MSELASAVKSEKVSASAYTRGGRSSCASCCPPSARRACPAGSCSTSHVATRTARPADHTSQMPSQRRPSRLVDQIMCGAHVERVELEMVILRVSETDSATDRESITILPLGADSCRGRRQAGRGYQPPPRVRESPRLRSASARQRRTGRRPASPSTYDACRTPWPALIDSP